MVHIRASMDDRFPKKSPKRSKRRTVKQLWIETESKWCEEANPFGLEPENVTPVSSPKACTPKVARTPPQTHFRTPQSRQNRHEGSKATCCERKVAEMFRAVSSPKRGSRQNLYERSSVAFSEKSESDFKDLSTLLTRMVQESRNQFHVLRHAKRRDLNQQLRDLEHCKTACQQTLHAMDEIVAPSAKMQASLIPPRLRDSERFNRPCKVQQQHSSLFSSRSTSPVMRALQGPCVHSLPSPKFLARDVPPMRLYARRTPTTWVWSPPGV